MNDIYIYISSHLNHTDIFHTRTCSQNFSDHFLLFNMDDDDILQHKNNITVNDFPTSLSLEYKNICLVGFVDFV